MVAVGALAALAWLAVTGWRTHRALEEARTLLHGGEAGKAMIALEPMLAAAPDDIDVKVLAAYAQLQVEHYPEAVRAAREVLAHRPGDGTALGVIAAAACRGSLASSAGELADGSVPSFASAGADALYLEAQCAESPRARLRLLDAALLADPAHAAALAHRARDLASEWLQLDEAAATAARMVSLYPGSASGHRTLAYVYLTAGDSERALAAIERALTVDPDDAPSYNLRALVRSNRGENREAVDDFSRAIARDPVGALPYINRAWRFVALGRFEEAEADARHALAINGESFGAYRVLLSALDRPDRADAHRETLARLETLAETYTAPSFRALALAEAAQATDPRESAHADSGEVLALAERSIAALPGSARSYGAAIAILRRRDDPEPLARACEQLAAIDIESPAERSDRAFLLADACGRPEPALADYDAAIDAAPSWGETFRLRGALHRARGRFDEALADLTKAVALFPWSPRAHYQRGELLADLERPEEALDEFDESAKHGSLVTELGVRSWADTLARLGKDDASVALLDREIARAPGEAAYLDKARQLRRLGKLDDAIEAAHGAMAALPDSVAARAMHASLLTLDASQCAAAATELRDLNKDPRSGTGPEQAAGGPWIIWAARSCPHEFDGALIRRQAEQADPQRARDADAHLALAYARYRRGELEDAREEVAAAQALTRAPKDDDPIVHFILAMIAAKDGSRAGARKEYDLGIARIARTYPKDPALALVRDAAAQAIGIPRPKAAGNAPSDDR